MSLSRRTFVGGLVATAAGVSRTFTSAAAFTVQPSAPQSAGAQDWPEWRGRGRLGVWTEPGILDRFPANGLRVLWRTPIRAGYAGPSVAGGRVFIADFQGSGTLRGTERALALDQATGRVLWAHEWPVSYRGMLDTWAIGPAATPTVDGDRVYMLGRAGALSCRKVDTGEVIWQKDYLKEYGAELPVWGMTGAPLVDGPRLICLVGGTPNAKVVAFDKLTGRELWRSLSSDAEPGYAQLIIVNGGGTRQLIAWHPQAVSSLDPETGRLFWEEPFKVEAGMTVATAVQSGSRLLVSCFYNGSVMFELDPKRPVARVLWRGRSNSEIQTDGLHAVVTTPVIDGEYVYGLCSYGQLRCLKAATGERVWESQDVTVERTRWASGQIVRHGNRYFITNDRGDLIIARLTPAGYEEVDRTALVKPTSAPGNRRALGVVSWTHPAFANRSIYVRNDQEIVCASLAG
jgi:outer membrane protein assembly factor BamB